MANERLLSLRMDPAEGRQLDLVAAVDQVTVSDVLRTAARQYVESRKADPAFRAAFKALHRELFGEADTRG